MPSPITHQLQDDRRSPVRCVLYVSESPEPEDKGKSFELVRGHMVIGKSPACELRLNDPSVSSEHARVSLTPTAIEVRDLDSTNGTRLGGHRVGQVELTDTARLQLGETWLDVVPLGSFSEADEDVFTSYGELAGKSGAMQELYRQLRRLESSSAPVLIHGETGTGKELVARAIHAHSARSQAPFQVVDCASVPAHLLESELFGHIKGAFTGAERDRKGAFRNAHGGTIFLDEMGELPLEMQPKLLRALESGHVKPVGSSDYEDVDVRVICATHRDLSERVESGEFRSDLFYRIAILVVQCPPLRARMEDLPLLITTLAQRLGVDEASVTPDARSFFDRYDWPGNIRELRNAIQRVSALGDAAVELSSTSTQNAPGYDPQERAPFREAKKRVVERFERAYLKDIWDRTGSISEAAREAGIDRKHVRELLKKYGLYDGEGT